MTFTAELLDQILAAADPGKGPVTVRDAKLDRVTFETETQFDGVTFQGDASFDGATFAGHAGFSGATFTGDAGFDGATFTGDADFDRVTFKGDAGFSEATFLGRTDFSEATFAADAEFDGATFTGRAQFSETTFTGDAEFSDATFTGDAEYSDATFTGDAEFSDATFTGDAGFGEATFTGRAGFRGATFQGYAGFDEATFTGDAEFNRTTFQGDAGFDGAMFRGDAGFDGAMFRGRADFREATLTNYAEFDGATFTGDAGFEGATFGDAYFRGATFMSDAGFEGATFTDDAWFEGAAIAGQARFDLATFTGVACFTGVTFERARQLGPMLVRGNLTLDGAISRERIRIEASAAVLSCRRARFLAGVELRGRWAEVVLDDADLAAPSVLSSAEPFPDLDDGDWPRVPGSAWPVDPRGTLRLLSVRGADLAGLTVAGVDLRACRFVGAHHLDQLRIEESEFAYTPTGRRWTSRQTIAEEHHRQEGLHRWGRDEMAAVQHPKDEPRGDRAWYGQVHRPPGWLEVEEPPSAAQIAAIYRDLRKGREDNKDEPGAADFYYGEMEMRRHAKRQQIRLERRRSHWGTAGAAGTEYAILWLYWLVSGYGLRAWRALACLAAVVLVASVIFAFWGFDRTAGLDELPAALLFSTQSTTALLRGPDPRALTTVGEWLLIALRLIGPVLLGLAVLSVRGRVKR